MSRIGKKPVPVPSNVQVNITSRQVSISGPTGTLSFEHHTSMTVLFDRGAGTITVTRRDDSRAARALHGLTRALLANMVLGVTKGFRKVVLIEGVGYGAILQGRTLLLNVGFANPVHLEIPAGLKVELPTAQRIICSGPDKQAVNAFAARIRSIRRADPYHQKGMRYEGEVIRRKVGKAFAAGAPA